MGLSTFCRTSTLLRMAHDQFGAFLMRNDDSAQNYLPYQEDFIMITGLQKSRRWLVALTIATFVALSAAYAPVALEMAGIAAGTPVYACNQPGAGC